MSIARADPDVMITRFLIEMARAERSAVQPPQAECGRSGIHAAEFSVLLFHPVALFQADPCDLPHMPEGQAQEPDPT
jgi:hypothetical protein